MSFLLFLLVVGPFGLNSFKFMFVLLLLLFDFPPDFCLLALVLVHYRCTARVLGPEFKYDFRRTLFPFSSLLSESKHSPLTRYLYILQFFAGVYILV